MKRLEPDKKNTAYLIDYVPDSLKTKVQLDYITEVLNYLRSNRQEYLKRLLNWELKDIDQAIWNFSREVENLRIHREFSMVKIFKEEIYIYKTAKEKMLKSISKENKKKINTSFGGHWFPMFTQVSPPTCAILN